jgi:hypothetical protein
VWDRGFGDEGGCPRLPKGGWVRARLWSVATPGLIFILTSGLRRGVRSRGKKEGREQSGVGDGGEGRAVTGCHMRLANLTIGK